MPGRLEYERAIRRSDLPPPSRHLALTIATWADMNTGIIPDQFQPSLGTLTVATGLDRKTVRRHLDGLENTKWLERNRPDEVKARTEHARTKYSLMIPMGAGSVADPGQELPQPGGGEPLASGEARGSVPPALGAQSPQAGGGEPPGKGHSSPSPRGGEPPKSPSQSRKSPKSQKVAKAAQRTSAPDAMPIEERMYVWAEAKGLDRARVDREHERFLDHHRAKGTTFTNWGAAWRTWMSRALEYAPRTQQQRPSATGHTPYRQQHPDSAYHEGQFF